MKELILDRTEAMHERLGTAGFVLSVIAIVLALTGGAYAASKLNGKQKKEVEKIAKKYAGKPGAPGAAGTNGTNGTNGKDGAQGIQGVPGKDGTSVTNTPIAANPANANCKEGGAEFKVGAGTPSYACNGSPWTAGGILPKGSSETGDFAPPKVGAFGPYPAPGLFIGEFMLPINFPIPLSAAPEFVFVAAEGEGFGTAEGCPGVVNGIAKAASGKFCFYQVGFDELITENIGGTGSMTAKAFSPASSIALDDPIDPQSSTGTSRSGAIVQLVCAEFENCSGAGLWAVTG